MNLKCNREYLLVNFGGPRSLTEIRPFLEELLTDPDVIQTPFPLFLQKLFFRYVARKRAKQIAHDYEKIGGKSPIYFDTETLKELLSEKLKAKVYTFHRYLPETHAQSLALLENSTAQSISVFPLFPQFSYSTTGSIARFLHRHLSQKSHQKLEWIRSYAEHPAFVHAFQNKIKQHLEKNSLLFFSPHGLPQAFIDQGDPYQQECERSFQAIQSAFLEHESVLAYQSKFGRGEWIKPYTAEVSQNLSSFQSDSVLFIPLSFTSDHIETLFEVEYQYLPQVRAQGKKAFRCPAFGSDPQWINAIVEILQSAPLLTTDKLFLEKKDQSIR